MTSANISTPSFYFVSGFHLGHTGRCLLVFKEPSAWEGIQQVKQCGIYFFEFCTSPFSDVGVIQGEAKVGNGQWGIRNFPEGNL